MKQLRYLGIQGWHAPSYRFRPFSNHLFKDFVESISGQQVLLISSMYRTDLFYYSSSDLNAQILKVWCLLTGHDYCSQTTKRFVAAYGEQGVFEIYFESMGDLRLHEKYFHQYRCKLNSISHLEPSNNILKELMQCDLHLTKDATSRNAEHTSLSDQNSNFSLHPSHEHFHTLCDHYIRRPFLN